MHSNEHPAQPKINKFKRKTVWVPRLQTVLIQQVWSRSKEPNPPANVGDVGSIPGLGRSPGEGNGNPLQYSRPENPMEREAWQAAVHVVAKSRIRWNMRAFKCSLTN